MAQRFLMSPPPKSWRIVGGENFKSEDRKAVDPEAAYWEWSRLLSAISFAGGEVHALDPKKYTNELLSGLTYAANWGRLWKSKNLFLLSRMKVPHRQKEAEVIRRFLEDKNFGFAIRQAESIWEGQADVADLPAGARILTYGPRSELPSVEELYRLRVLDLTDASSSASRMPALGQAILEPFFHGDTCLNLVATPKGPVALIYPGAFADNEARTAAWWSVKLRAEVILVNREDALAYAGNALTVGHTFIYLEGISDALLKQMDNRGLELVEIQMINLFGTGGGGPRCLVNRLDEQF